MYGSTATASKYSWKSSSRQHGAIGLYASRPLIVSSGHGTVPVWNLPGVSGDRSAGADLAAALDPCDDVASGETAGQAGCVEGTWFHADGEGTCSLVKVAAWAFDRPLQTAWFAESGQGVQRCADCRTRVVWCMAGRTRQRREPDLSHMGTSSRSSSPAHPPLISRGARAGGVCCLPPEDVQQCFGYIRRRATESAVLPPGSLE